MKFSATVVALLASVGIVAALPEAGNGKGHLTSSCWTKSTCKATYYTYPATKTKEVTVTATTTVYKPETKTSYVPSVYTSTKIITVWGKTSETYLSTKKTKYSTNYWTTTCKSIEVPTYVWTSEVYTETKYHPTKSLSTSYCPETTKVPSTYVTSTPCPETTTLVSYSPYTTAYTKWSSTCDTWTGWKTWTAGW